MKVRLTLLAVVLAATVLLTALAAASSAPQQSANYSGFAVGGRSFALTFVATNQSAQAKGLMGAKITNTTTMLFVFPPAPAEHLFWMNGVNSSLDIIWIYASNDTATVVYISNDVPGCDSGALCARYGWGTSANLVLEAKGGFAQANSIAVGSAIVFLR